jgi:hypothetical protein
MRFPSAKAPGSRPTSGKTGADVLKKGPALRVPALYFSALSSDLDAPP